MRFESIPVTDFYQKELEMNALPKSLVRDVLFLFSLTCLSLVIPSKSLAGELDYGNLPLTEDLTKNLSQDSTSSFSFKGFIFTRNSGYKVFTIRCSSTQGTLLVGEERYRLLDLSVEKGTSKTDSLPEGLKSKIADKEVIGSIHGRIVKSSLKISDDKVSAAGQIALGTIGKFEAVVLRNGTSSVLEGGITEGDLGGPLLALPIPSTELAVSSPAEKKDVILANTLSYSQENLLVEGKAPAVYDGLGEK